MIHLGRQVELVEQLVIHVIEWFGGIYVEEVVFLVPYILTQLIPLHFSHTNYDFIK